MESTVIQSTLLEIAQESHNNATKPTSPVIPKINNQANGKGSLKSKT